jgi:hypothetical protein
VPLIGKLPADYSQSAAANGQGPQNILRHTLEEIGSMVSTSWASWDEERQGVVYHTAVPLGDKARGPEASIQVFFPGGGHWATEQDVAFPKKFRLKRAFAPIVEDARVQLRAAVHENRVFPTAESLSFGVRMLGFRLTGAQTIEYTHASPCSGW